MKVVVCGWNRDMGQTEIGNHDLLYTKYITDWPEYPREPVIYKNPRNSISVAWFKQLKLTGNYRAEVEFTKSDIMRLFKCCFGSELQSELIKEYGLTFSPEVVKSVLKTV